MFEIASMKPLPRVFVEMRKVRMILVSTRSTIQGESRASG